MNYKFQINLSIIVSLFKTTMLSLVPDFMIISLIVILMLTIVNFGFSIIKGNAKFPFIFLIFSFYLFAHIFFFGILNPSLNSAIPFLGALQILINAFFWYSLFLTNMHIVNKVFNYFIKATLQYSVVVSLGAIIQFYISPTLFGLINNRLYSNEAVLSNVNFAKRAISFISSPQNLGVFQGLIFSLSLTQFKKYFSSNFYYLFLGLTLFAGILSGSKAFYLFISIYLFYFLVLRNKIKWNYILISVLLFLSLPLIFPSLYMTETIQRIIIVFNVVSFSDISVVSIWGFFFESFDTTLKIIFGQGLGLLSSYSQLTFGYKILNGSSESYLLQLFYEIGLIGLFIWLTFFKISINKLKSQSELRDYAFVLIALFLNLLFTPSFYGLIISFFFYPFIIIGYFKHTYNSGVENKS